MGSNDLKSTLQVVAGTIVTVCCVALTALVVRREFFTPLPTARSGPPVEVDDWPQVAGAGHRIGTPDAPVTIVVFSDFECPFCRRFAIDTWPALRSEFGESVAMVFRHYPLSNHRLAYPSARAAECAAAQGRFEEMHDAIFTDHDQLGLKPFHWYAQRAGIADLNAFDHCMDDPELLPAVTRDIAEVRRIGGRGTPTVVINGLRLQSAASPDNMSGIIRDILRQSAN